MQAVVLVGGFGTRLRPLTNSIPKQLLDVAGIPMIERVLAALAAHGVDRAVLSMGYLPDPFIDRYPSRQVADVEVHFAVEPEPLDTAGAIAFAARSVGLDTTFLAVNGDVLTDLDVTALVRLHHEAGAEGTVALTPVEDPSRFGVVVTDADGRVTSWVEKPEGEAPSNHINAGTYVLEPSVLDRVDADVPVSIERVVFPAMVADGTLFGRVDTSYWLDAGTPAAYLRANLDVVDGTRASLTPGRRAATGLVLDGAAVADSASVRGSVLGRGVRVGERARIEGSVLLDGAQLGDDTVIVASVVGPGATVGRRAELRDHCVVAARAHIPEGANLEREGVAA